MTAEEIAKAVGHIPSGLFIVCAYDRRDNKIDGYLASWVQQVSFNPLRISLAVKPGRPAYEIISGGRTFSVNIVGDQDKSFLKHFWKGYDPAVNPFDEIDHRITDEGAVIINGAKSTIECVMVDRFTPGDHELVIADVKASYVQNEEAKPLTHIRKSGLDY